RKNKLVVDQRGGVWLTNPRRHPQQGFNESILATGFWFLGEEVHSPVDIRQDQADRFDNKVDVLSKAFLGLTVACARCHDHKFDAIATKDYYSQFGFLRAAIIGWRASIRWSTIAASPPSCRRYDKSPGRRFKKRWRRRCVRLQDERPSICWRRARRCWLMRIRRRDWRRSPTLT